jgi:hypothetical protein
MDNFKVTLKNTNLIGAGISGNFPDWSDYNYLSGAIDANADDIIELSGKIINENSEYDYIVTPGSYFDLKVALESGAYRTIFVPNGIYLWTDDTDTAITVHENVELIVGASEEVTFNVNMNNLTNLVTAIKFHSNCLISNFTAINFKANHLTADRGVFEGTFNDDINIYNPSEAYRMSTISDAKAIDTLNLTPGVNGNQYLFYKLSVKNVYLEAGGFMNGLRRCKNVIDVTVVDPSVGFDTCYNVFTCTANVDEVNSSFGIGFFENVNIIGSTTNNVEDGFYYCYNVAGCYGRKTDVAFNSCENLSSCKAENGDTAYSHCRNVDEMTCSASYMNIDYIGCIFDRYIRDDTDNSKMCNFDLSLLSASTSHTYQYPNKDGVFAMLSDITVDPNISGDIAFLSGNIDVNTLDIYELSGDTINLSGQILDNDADILSLSGNIDELTYFDYTVNANDYTDLKQALESGQYRTIFIPNGTYTWTDDVDTAIVVHANVEYVKGASRNVIFDVNKQNLPNLITAIKFHSDCKIKTGTIVNFKMTGGGAAVDRGVFEGTFNDDLSLYDALKAYKMSEVEDFIVKDINGYSANASNGESIFARISVFNSYLDTGKYHHGLVRCKNVSRVVIENPSRAFTDSNNIIGCAVFLDTNHTRFGIGYLNCFEIVGCQSVNAESGFYGCKNIAGCYSRLAGYNYRNSTNISSCIAVEGSYGFSDCFNVDEMTCYAGTNITTKYQLCTFNRVKHADMDNTKMADFDLSLISQNVTRTYSYPDNDGVFALTGDISGMVKLDELNVGDIELSGNMTLPEISGNHTIVTTDSNGTLNNVEIQAYNTALSGSLLGLKAFDANPPAAALVSGDTFIKVNGTGVYLTFFDGVDFYSTQMVKE